MDNKFGAIATIVGLADWIIVIVIRIDHAAAIGQIFIAPICDTHDDCCGCDSCDLAHRSTSTSDHVTTNTFWI